MITPLLQLATLFLIQARVPLAFLTTWAYCWLMFSWLSTNTRQRSGEAQQGWAQTHDSPQLLALAGDFHCPEVFLSASATFLLCRLPGPHPPRSRWVGASILLSHKASRMHGSSHMQPTEALSSQSCVLVVHSVRDGWEQSFLATGTGCFLLEAAACRIPFISLLSQLLQAGMLAQSPPQTAP